MVNITALQRLSRLISNDNLQPMKKWSTRFRIVELDGRQSWYLKGLVRQIRNILNIVSGFDIVQMIRGDNRFFYNYYCKKNIIIFCRCFD